MKSHPLSQICSVLLALIFLATVVTPASAHAPTAEAILPGQDDGQTLNGFTVTYGGRTFDDGLGQTTFTYVVSGTGVDPDLSHFDLGIPSCEEALEVVAYSPTEAVDFVVDPTTGVDGIKWDLPLSVDDSRTYTITFQGNVREGEVMVAVKGGTGFEAALVPGPSCTVNSIDIEKLVSVDGVTWLDADSAPGPDVALDGEVSFRLVVTNDGNSDVTGITLSDNLLDTSGCTIPDTLAADASFECPIGPLPPDEGQHHNVASVSATTVEDSQPVADTDAAYYFGGDRPEVTVEKLVSIDGGTNWIDADTPTGPIVEVGGDVRFLVTIHNTGNVALSGLSLSDTAFDTGNCQLLDPLDVDMQYECMFGPFAAIEGQHSNTATVSAEHEGTTISDDDMAHYFGGEVDLPVYYNIQGDVTAINGNVIIIFGFFEITLDPDDPLLQVLQIGDVILITGQEAEGVIVVATGNVVVINVEIYINGDQVWRDSGECANPPPPWAPAHGWRAKCEEGRHPGR